MQTIWAFLIGTILGGNVGFLAAAVLRADKEVTE